MKSRPTLGKRLAIATAALLGSGLLVWACQGGAGRGGSAQEGSAIRKIVQQRDLSANDVTAALETYMPSGKIDPYLIFFSGGHSGQIIVAGVPSMRILKVIGVFTPEPWQGYGFDDDTKAMLKASSPPGESLTWGDTHHPALSETNGDYDGQYLFINDKANARIAVLSLRDFATHQIVRSGLMNSDHGTTFVTPNTEYVIETSQYPVPLGGTYAPLNQKSYNDNYRGVAVFWKFDRDKGRIDKDQSFAIELPPYMQDLSDAGKLGSYGWSFTNSFDTERAFGGDAQPGGVALEQGASQNEYDYMHVFNWKKAAEVVKDKSNYRMLGGMRLIPLATAVKQGLLFFVPEPKSPHGVDVTPDGKYLCVAGKLDTHVTVYDFGKMMQLIDQKQFAGTDPYGVPILPFKESLRGQVEVGLGPLHTQFDGRGNAYTTLFIESKIAKWSLATLKVTDKIPVQYNVGHLCVPGGDTVHPTDKYLIALDKWSIDRFKNVGPLLPQDEQLIDISGDKMKLLYNMPLGMGEPHYAQAISSDLVNAYKIYKPGTNQVTDAPDPNATPSEDKARVERHGNVVDVYATEIRSHIRPDIIEVNQGDVVHFHVTNLEQTQDATHGFGIGEYNVNLSMEPGRTANVTIVADRPGVFPFYCTEFCSALHLEMAGYLLVKPSSQGRAASR
jgi:nitrous-oxide reductase